MKTFFSRIKYLFVILFATPKKTWTVFPKDGMKEEKDGVYECYALFAKNKMIGNCYANPSEAAKLSKKISIWIFFCCYYGFFTKKINPNWGKNSIFSNFLKKVLA